MLGVATNYYNFTSDVQVTLDIIKSLIEKTHEDLNLFAQYVLSILLSVIKSNDLALCQHASSVVDTFCQYHDGALFSGDPSYVQQFHQLVESYVSLTENSIAGPNEAQWKLVGLEALKSFSSSVAISTPTGLSHIHKIVPAVLSTLAADSTSSSLVQIGSHLNPLGRRESRRYSTAPEPPTLTGESLLLSTSMTALKQLYDTTSNMVLKATVVTTLAFIRGSPMPEQWKSTLIITCAKWVPVQIRFTMVSLLVDKLTTLPLEDISYQVSIAHLTSSLLSSSVNMIGLSVIDVQRSLLHRQAVVLRNVTQEHYHAGQPSIYDLIAILRKCIVDLASHIYYATQIPDMLSELLYRFQDAMPNASAHSTGANTPMGATLGIDTVNTNANSLFHSLYISNILKTITKILALSSARANQGHDISLTISSWDGTQKLLTHPDPEVRTTFANTIIMLLTNQSIQSSPVLALNGGPGFTVTSGPVGRIIWELNNLANAHQLPLVSDYLAIYHISTVLITNLSLKGAVRAVALAFELQEKAQELISRNKDVDLPSTPAALIHAIALASVSIAVFNILAKTFDFEGLYEFTKEEIDRRKAARLWYPAIDSPLAHGFLSDVSQKIDILKKKPYTFSCINSPGMIETMQFLTKEDVSDPFAGYSEVSAEVRQAIVEPLPPADEINTYTSGPVSTRSSSDQGGLETGNRTSRYVNRARSLKQLNYNTTRAIPAFYVSTVGSGAQTPRTVDMAPNVHSGLNGGNTGPEISTGTPAVIDISDPEHSREIQNGAETNVDVGTLTGQQHSAEGNEAPEAASERRIANGLSKTVTNSTLSDDNPSYNSTTVSNGNDNHQVSLEPQHNGLAFPLPIPGQIRAVQSFGDVYREFTPRVKDLKKAASGYKLPYGMGASPAGSGSVNAIAAVAASYGAGNGNSFIPRQNYASSQAGANNGYAQSISSVFTRGSEFDNSYSDSGSINGHSTTQHIHAASKPLLPNEQFDVSSFLSNLTIDPALERGKLV